jgi:hypothetical protein
MYKYVFIAVLSTPAFAGDAIINLSGTSNILNVTQVGDSSVSVNVSNPYNANNVYSVNQVGGGNHSANVNLNGEFKNYNFSLTQNSSSGLSISITQTCPTSSCTPAPYSFTQY